MTSRDYRLTGPDGAHAVATGLAAADWYHSDIPRQTMKALMKRTDQPAIRDTALLFASMFLFAGVGVALLPSLWSAPFFLAYGVCCMARR